MKQATLCFCLKDDDVLLAMKKRGFGEGKYNGFGGKEEEEDKTIRDATVRELWQESTLVANPDDLEQVALIDFYFEDEFKFKCHVFILRTWEGAPAETDEMRPQWFPASELPFTEMWVADTQWLPLVLQGKKLRGTIVFNQDGSEIRSSEYEETEFD